MNKLKNLFLLGLVAVSAVTISSCEKNNTDNGSNNPSLALVKPSSKEVTVAQGATVDVEVLAAANDKNLESFRVEFSQGGGPFTAYSGAFPAGKSDTTFNVSNFTYKKTLPTLAGEGTITYRFYTVDKDNNSASLDLKINVGGAPGATISSYSARIMGSQSNSTTGSFLATTNGIVYKIAEAKANSTLIDVLYYYGANNKATLAAPNDADAGTVYNSGASALSSWSKRNATKFEATALSEANFNSINSSTTLTAFYLTDPTASASTDLANNDVLKFRTEAGKRGFILVKTISGTNTSSGFISVDVKVEK